VFGFGKGKIEITLEKYNFSSGETIRGKISLHLDKSVKAKAVKAGLNGQKRIYSTEVNQSGHMQTDSQFVDVFNFGMPLDGEKEYPAGDYEYNFEIKVPTDADISGGMTTNVLNTVETVYSGSKMSKIYWWVFAKLDIPMGLDVSKRVQVNIG